MNRINSLWETFFPAVREEWDTVIQQSSSLLKTHGAWTLADWNIIVAYELEPGTWFIPVMFSLRLFINFILPSRHIVPGSILILL